MNRIFTVAFALLLALCAFSAPARGAVSSATQGEVPDSAVVRRLKCDVEFLADSLCEGRKIGSKGSVEASWLVGRCFASCGLQPLSSLASSRAASAMGDGWYHSFTAGETVGRNVIGVLPGTSGRYIIVAAHYDGFPGSRFLPGADSNASGVTALMELARSIAPRKTGIIFVALDGSNAGYLGTKALVAQLESLKLLSKVTLFVNLDVLGSTLAPVDKGVDKFIIALGGKKYFDSMEKAAGPLRLDVNYDYYGSRNFTELFYNRIGDQTVFQKLGIKTIVFTSGVTMNTNKPTDTPDTLNYDIFALRLLFLERWLTSIL